MLVKIGRKAVVDYLAVNGVIRLTQNSPVPLDLDVTMADIVEANFGGYAPFAGVAFPAATLDGANHGRTTSPLMTSTPTGVGLPQTVYAVYMTVGGVLWFFKRFTTPVIVETDADLVRFIIQLAGDDSAVAAFS